ncbi:hypothetical protein NQZ68_027357 [Dissostichus eleginoides]|nr:hypothetical protein NQZ68_027357 [Dissostichus eleginoides]
MSTSRRVVVSFSLQTTNVKYSTDAGLVIDEPQSPWEPEMARLMNGAFLQPPYPTPSPQPLHPAASAANPNTSPSLAIHPLCQ